MSRPSPLWLALVLAVSAASCGGGGGGTGGGGSGGGGAGGAGAGASCDGVCNALFAQHCFYGGGESDCRRSCNGWETQYVAVGADYCKQAWADWKGCAASAALVCANDSDPDWNALPCRHHWDHVQNYCINKNATPDTPCLPDNAVLNTFCAGTPATPNGKSCFGNPPQGCVVGGTSNNANLYCCP